MRVCFRGCSTASILFDSAISASLMANCSLQSKAFAMSPLSSKLIDPWTSRSGDGRQHGWDVGFADRASLCTLDLKALGVENMATLQLTAR